MNKRLLKIYWFMWLDCLAGAAVTITAIICDPLPLKDVIACVFCAALTIGLGLYTSKLIADAKSN